MTRFHSRGESIPPCGHFLVANSLMVPPDNVVIMFLLSSIELIHLKIAGLMPCLSAACVITSN
jgi:hypothetical protein